MRDAVGDKRAHRVESPHAAFGKGALVDVARGDLQIWAAIEVADSVVAPHKWQGVALQAALRERLRLRAD